MWDDVEDYISDDDEEKYNHISSLIIQKYSIHFHMKIWYFFDRFQK